MKIISKGKNFFMDELESYKKTQEEKNNYWWTIGILKNSAAVYRNEKYSETVVDE